MSEHNNNLEQNSEQLIQTINDIQSKLGATSGYLLAMRDSINHQFKELKKQNDEHLHILTRKANIHFYSMIIFAYCLFIFFILFLK